MKVLDFGIAKAAPDMMETGSLDLTRDNVFQGTPAYIAPEQALNGPQVDHRADIYATGCVAYFLLTGKPVFTGDSPMAVVVHHAIHSANSAVVTFRVADPSRARPTDPGLSREESRRSPAVRARAVANDWRRRWR